MSEAALQFALSQVGDAYVALPSGAMNTGLTTNDESWDCSGLTWRAYYEAGLDWPAMPSYSQMNSPFVKEIPLTEAKPGDLVFYDFLNDPEIIPRGLTGRSGVDHVAMVLDPNEGTVVEAGNETVGVRVTHYLNPDGSPIAPFISVGRVIEGETRAPGDNTFPLVDKGRFQRLLQLARTQQPETEYVRATTYRRSGVEEVTATAVTPISPLQLLKGLPKAIERNQWEPAISKVPDGTQITLTNPHNPLWQTTFTFLHAKGNLSAVNLEVRDKESKHITLLTQSTFPANGTRAASPTGAPPLGR